MDRMINKISKVEGITCKDLEGYYSTTTKYLSTYCENTNFSFSPYSYQEVI